MRHIVIILLTFWVFNVNAQNVSLFENDVRFYKENVRTTFTHYGEFEITEKFGIADYVFVTNDWAEFTIGPYLKIGDGLIAVLPGLETNNKFRIGFYGYYVFNKLTTVSAFYEKGVVDYFDFQIRNDHKRLTYMFRLRQDYGLGIPIGYKLGNVQVMYTTYYNVEKIGKHTWLPTLSLNLTFP